jgi:hypothetical protein
MANPKKPKKKQEIPEWAKIMESAFDTVQGDTERVVNAWKLIATGTLAKSWPIGVELVQRVDAVEAAFDELLSFMEAVVGDEKPHNN